MALGAPGPLPPAAHSFHLEPTRLDSFWTMLHGAHGGRVAVGSAQAAGGSGAAPARWGLGGWGLGPHPPPIRMTIPRFLLYPVLVGGKRLLRPGNLPISDTHSDHCRQVMSLCVSEYTHTLMSLLKISTLLVSETTLSCISTVGCWLLALPGSRAQCGTWSTWSAV